jgi:Tfp pilus assembly protein PilV
MNSSKRGQSGFAIAESLIALVIMGFGMFSLSSMQMALSRHADDARQRTEAVRMAQEKMEQLRSYTGIETSVPGPDTLSANALNWNALHNGQDSTTSNAVYVRSWTLGGNTENPMRAATVQVAWADRTNAAQTVTLSSILSRSDPVDSGLLGFPLPIDGQRKHPKNRNPAIPVSAIDLGNKLSALPFGHAGQYILLNNLSANVVQTCALAQESSHAQAAEIIAAFKKSESRHCNALNAYLVSGYVGRDSSVSASDWNAIENGLGIDYSGISRHAAGTLGIACQFGNAVNQASGAPIPDFKFYLCVIPLAAPAANTAYDWSGKILLAGPAPWHASASKFHVCRYEYAATRELTDGNRRNVQPYVHVSSSISQQNYLVASSSNATDSAAPVCPSTMNVTNVSTGILHQDCRSASNPAGHAADCPLFAATP